MIYTKTFSAPGYNTKEILRYSGACSDMDVAEELIEECIAEAEPVLTYKVCYGEFLVTVTKEHTQIEMLSFTSKDLSKNLDGCKSVVLFAATVGIGIDRLIAKYGSISPVKALIFQAIGAERIEALCNTFCDYISTDAEKQGEFTRARFSPGYGDLPIDAQKDFFRILDCPRKIGLTLNESLLMSPSKSVTAVIGISDYQRKTVSGCASCKKTDCEYRKRN